MDHGRARKSTEEKLTARKSTEMIPEMSTESTEKHGNGFLTIPEMIPELWGMGSSPTHKFRDHESCRDFGGV